MPREKKKFASTTDSLISVLKESEVLAQQLEKTLDSLNSLISTHETSMQQLQKDNDSIETVLGKMKNKNQVKIKNLVNLKAQIEFAGPDLKKLRKKIPEKNITINFISDYIYHASANVEAISMQLYKMEGYCRKQEQELFSLKKYIENEIQAVNKP